MRVGAYTQTHARYILATTRKKTCLCASSRDKKREGEREGKRESEWAKFIIHTHTHKASSRVRRHDVTCKTKQHVIVMFNGKR